MANPLLHGEPADAAAFVESASVKDVLAAIAEAPDDIARGALAEFVAHVERHTRGEKARTSLLEACERLAATPDAAADPDAGSAPSGRLRCVANAEFVAAARNGQVLRLRAGQVVEGDVAAWLLDHGAPVHRVDVDLED